MFIKPNLLRGWEEKKGVRKAQIVCPFLFFYYTPTVANMSSQWMAVSIFWFKNLSSPAMFKMGQHDNKWNLFSRNFGESQCFITIFWLRVVLKVLMNSSTGGTNDGKISLSCEHKWRSSAFRRAEIRHSRWFVLLSDAYIFLLWAWQFIIWLFIIIITMHKNKAY